MPDPVILPTTNDDIVDFYGGQVEWELMAWTVFYRGEKKAIIGVRISEYGNVVFSDVKPNDMPLLQRIRTAKTIMGFIRDCGLKNIITVGLPEEGQSEGYSKKSGKLFAVMGFKPVRWCDDGYHIFALG